MKYIFFLVTVSLQAQTTIKPEQLRAAPPEAPRPVLLAFGPKGFTPVTIGPAISVSTTVNGYIIDVFSWKQPVLTVVERLVTQSADGSYDVPQNASVYRNGLRMAAGVDYTRAAAKITPKTPWAADDIVVIEEITLL